MAAVRYDICCFNACGRDLNQYFYSFSAPAVFKLRSHSLANDVKALRDLFPELLHLGNFILPVLARVELQLLVLAALGLHGSLAVGLLAVFHNDFTVSFLLGTVVLILELLDESISDNISLHKLLVFDGDDNSVVLLGSETRLDRHLELDLILSAAHVLHK